jgi:hypothetical protein
MRDVEAASIVVAAKHGNDEFIIPLSRLFDIETKAITPNIYRVFSLAVIYRVEVKTILSWYGVDLSEVSQPSRPVVSARKEENPEVLPLGPRGTHDQFPIRTDFDLRRTVSLGRSCGEWGLAPLAQLPPRSRRQLSYGYVGTEDYTMYPLLPPGSFIQIDESKTEIREGVWRSEFERPIYFVETREEDTCCWLTRKNGHIILQPHPLSPRQVRVLRFPQDVEVLGEVVAVAMRLGEWRDPAASRLNP